MNSITKADRLANFIVDVIAIMITSSIISLILSSALNMFHVYNICFVIIMFLYYFILESTTGQTLGKMITKTKVVNPQNQKPKAIKILFRTLLRFIFIDAYSFLFGMEYGCHDILSGTKLIKSQ